MADPRVASSANSYRNWVNPRKATLDKLTTLANTRPSQMLGDNIKDNHRQAQSIRRRRA